MRIGLNSRGRFAHLGMAVAATGALTSSLFAPQAAGATSGHHIEVTTPQQASTFDGVVTRHGPTGLDGVPQCAVTDCEHFGLDVTLPREAWEGKPGGVQVTLEWHQRFNDIVGLYIFKGGENVGSSDAGVATFQSVRLVTGESPDSTPNGHYDVYAAYEGYVDDNGMEPSQSIRFHGWAQVEYAPPRLPVRDLLPNIVPLPATQVTFTPIAIFGDTPDPNVPSCFRSEVEEHPGLRLCLRVEQRMYDQNGPDRGPVEINFSLPTGQTPPSAPADQRIYRSDGTSWTRSAGAVMFHPVHGHYHYEHYTRSDTYAIDADGNPVGAPVAAGVKNGFCLADTDVAAREHQQYVAPMTYTAPGCLSPRSFSPDGATSFFVEGEGTGNGDTYEPDLPDQFMDATNLHDGVFIVRTVVDPTHKLLESDPHDNCIQVYIRVNGIGTANPTAHILDTYQNRTAPTCVS